MTSTVVTSGADLRINDHGPFSYTLHEEQETIELTYDYRETYVPDLEWFTVDPLGHYHSYDSDGKLPTLDNAFLGGYQCKLCREYIYPTTIVKRHTPIDCIPGRMSATLFVPNFNEPLATDKRFRSTRNSSLALARLQVLRSRER